MAEVVTCWTGMLTEWVLVPLEPLKSTQRYLLEGSGGLKNEKLKCKHKRMFGNLLLVNGVCHLCRCMPQRPEIGTGLNAQNRVSETLYICLLKKSYSGNSSYTGKI